MYEWFSSAQIISQLNEVNQAHLTNIYSHANEVYESYDSDLA